LSFDPNGLLRPKAVAFIRSSASQSSQRYTVQAQIFGRGVVELRRVLAAERPSSFKTGAIELDTGRQCGSSEFAPLPIRPRDSRVCLIMSPRAAAALRRKTQNDGGIARKISPQLLLFFHTRRSRSSRSILRLSKTSPMRDNGKVLTGAERRATKVVCTTAY
jgi:hypothetical protein